MTSRSRPSHDRWILGSTVMAGAFALTAGSASADVDAMVAAFEKGCVAGPARLVAPAGTGRWGTIPVGQVQEAVFKGFEVDRTLLSHAGGRALALRIQALVAGRQPTPAVPQDAQPLLRRLWDQVDQWGGPNPDAAGDLRTLAEGGLMIVDALGRPTNDRTADVLADILAGSTESYSFICKLPSASEPSQQPTSSTIPTAAGSQVETVTGPAFVLVKTKAGLGELSLEEKEFAEFSYSDDQEGSEVSHGWAVTAGLRFPEYAHSFRGALEGLRFSASLIPYVSYDRQGSDDPAAEGYVNNLNIGLQAAGDYEFRGSTTWGGGYALSFEHETDDDFRSDADSIEFRLSPPLPLSWPWYRMFSGVTRPTDVLDLRARWSLEGVADWVDVENPGLKKALTERSTYRRLGYDAGLDFRFGHRDLEWRVLWTNRYQVRDGRTPAGGDAELFSSSLQFKLSDESHYSFGLTFEKGENLQSLEQTDIWKLALGVRF